MLAVSGGVDSMVLLDLFLKIASSWNLKLCVAHLNHGLRGHSADRDEGFVRDIAREKGVPFFSSKVNVRQYVVLRKISLEEGARECRFRYLESILDRLKYNRLVLGHHANDQAETILMNLARGSGLRGLAGIRPKRGRIIHPLLNITREEIEQYASNGNLSFVEDASNRDKRFLRNRIRWNMLARLELSIGHKVVTAICRSGNAAEEAGQFITDTADRVRHRISELGNGEEIILDIYKFLSYFKTVQKEIVLKIIEEIGSPRRRVRYTEIERVICLAKEGRSGGIVELGAIGRVIRTPNRLVFQKKQIFFPRIAIQIGKVIGIKETGSQFYSEIISSIPGKLCFSQNPFEEYLDYDLLQMPLELRSFQQGDWFIPLGMEYKKKLHNFFIDSRIPNFRRISVPLLIAGDSVIWVVGFRIDDRFKVTDNTKRALFVKFIPSGNLWKRDSDKKLPTFFNRIFEK